MAKKKAIMRNVLTCFIVFAILMSVMPLPVFAMNSSNNATEASNHSNDLEKSFILPLVSNDTGETVSTLSCDVYIKIDDDTCVGYDVYVDGVYQFTEGQSGTPDGYCAFYVSAGTHKFELRKNGCTTSKSWYCQCNTVYIWVSMPDYWCECGGNGNCDNPPTVNFDKSKYYVGDSVHATVSTHHVSVYYEIKDCSGIIRESGHVSNGETISYTIPSSASECCYWDICFYWDVDDYPATINAMARYIDRCSKCYTFYVCPKTTCEVWVEVVDKYCNGYELYVDGVYQFTEGQDGTPDGYCSFHVTQGTHKFELRKNGCSVSKSWYCQCGTDYSWVSMNDMDPHWCDSHQQKKEVTFRGIVTGTSPEGLIGAGHWYVNVDEWISGSLPCDEIDVAIGIYPPMGSCDEDINKGDSVEVYGVVDPWGGSECTVGLNGESYYIKKASSNSPPTLTAGKVNGETLYHCDTSTQLIFTVTYSDPDNDDPEYVKLKIGDSFYDMVKADPGDNDYTDGCVYMYSTIMSRGKYFFTFSTSDGNHLVSIEPNLSCPFRDRAYLEAYSVIMDDLYYYGGGNFIEADFSDIINYYLCNYSCADCVHIQEILGRALQYVPEANKTLGADEVFLEYPCLTTVSGTQKEIKFIGEVIEPDNKLLDDQFDCKVKIDKIIETSGDININVGDEVLVTKWWACGFNEPGAKLEPEIWNIENGDKVEVYGNLSEGYFTSTGHSDSSFLVDLCGSDSYYFNISPSTTSCGEILEYAISDGTYPPGQKVIADLKYKSLLSTSADFKGVFKVRSPTGDIYTYNSKKESTPAGHEDRFGYNMGNHFTIQIPEDASTGWYDAKLELRNFYTDELCDETEWLEDQFKIEDREEIKFVGTAIEYFSRIGAGGWTVRADEIINGPSELQGHTVSVALWSVDPDQYPPGYIDPNIEPGNKVEVYGLYVGEDDVTLSGSNDYYIKKKIAVTYEDWPMFRHDARHTGYSSSTTPNNNNIAWIYETEGKVTSSPVVANSKVFVGSDDGKIYCLDERTGKPIWIYKTEGSVRSSPAVANGKVFIGSRDHNIYCLNETTGKLIWSKETGDWVDSSPTVTNGRVFVGSKDYNIYCLDENTGRQIWNRSTRGQVYASPAVADGVVYIGDNYGKIYALRESDGKLNWDYKTLGSIESSPAVANGKVYVGSFSLDYFYCFEVNGKLSWKSQDIKSTVTSSPAVANGKVFVGSRDNKIYCLNGNTGHLIWSKETGDCVDSSPAIADGKVFVGSYDNKIYALDDDKGELVWSYETGDEIWSSSPAVANGKVFIGSNDGKIYAFGSSVSGCINFDELRQGDITGQTLHYDQVDFVAEGEPPYGHVGVQSLAHSSPNSIGLWGGKITALLKTYPLQIKG